ncbi:uncharacterized protein L3040_003317 [Drepanopeziza brunnea f. sp. 'multigermtubi']|nr:hypothetical protein L3040_003317 [Drepanopeziza brunnea f. sp. 'multigermtubi']
MANSSLFYAYQETRLDLDSPSQGTTIAIRLPAGASIYSRPASKRSRAVELPIAEDENAFRQRYLASAASIYHRTHYKSPRSFLWRVLEDGKVLSIRSVDVSRASKAVDANLTLRMSIPSAIRQGCIAITDSPEHDTLSVFFLTENKQLYTLTLKPEYFRKAASTEDNVGEWCKVYNSAGLGIKHPHRLVALGVDDLLISMIDGGLLRLNRSSGTGNFLWKETHYNEGGWGLNVRSISLFQRANMISYAGQNMELSAATSIAAPEIQLDGTPFAFTVCLDHRLRIWNLATGKIACTKDILADDQEQPDQPKKVIDPSQSQLVKLLGDNEESALCVTYSPLGSGEFKFWNVTPRADGKLDISDIFQGSLLKPLLPKPDEIWTLADFSVVLDRDDHNKISLWVLWKNDIASHLHYLEFYRNADVGQVEVAWKEDWMAMKKCPALDKSPPPIVFSGDSSDGTEKWLELILHPGRFTTATLETGLAIYTRGLGSLKASARKPGSLPDRLCTTIAAAATLNRSSSGDMDYEQFRLATDAQWRRFFRVIFELDQQRGEAMSLSVNPEGDMPWLVLADGISASRDCSPLERILFNHDRAYSENEHVARPLFAATDFRKSLSEQFLHACKTQMLEEIWQQPSLTAPARMRIFYEKCDFTGQIGDDSFHDLQVDLGGNFKNVTSQVYTAILQLMNASEDFERAKNQPLAETGYKLLMKGVQDTVELHREICLDQLILLILIEYEINHSEDGIQFESGVVFLELLNLLQNLECIRWLVRTQITLDVPKLERSNSLDVQAPSSTKKVPTPKTVTVLEGAFRYLLGLDLRPGERMTSVVTEQILQICAIDSSYEVQTSLMQCWLLKEGRPDLAIEFSHFTAHDAFSIYVQGRVHLANNDAPAASALFKKAAFGMGHPDPKKRSDYRSGGFIDDTERTLLNAGLPEYYSHIVALFEKEKNYSYVIDFARLTLQFFRVGHEDVYLTRIRKDMHSRLFSAAIQTSRYELAHSTLCLFTDSALQQSSLRILVTKMCEASCASQLIDLPFLGLQENVDDILRQKCQSIVEVNNGIPYHKILYAWRIKHSDFRGAAAISLERLQRLQQSGDGDKIIGDGGLETPVTKQYVALINALSCVDPKQAWILSEELPRKSSTAGVNCKKTPPKRHVVTLDDVRRAYQAELDRLAAIANNQFAFGGGDEMDVL